MRRMRYLSIDYGHKRVGLAICDTSQTIVSPLTTIQRRDDTQVIERIATITAEQAVDGIVLGLPVNMDGSEGPQAEKVRNFARLLAETVHVSLHFQNEQLSSFAADHRLIGRELTRAGKRSRQDAVAAAVILEDFLKNR